MPDNQTPLRVNGSRLVGPSGDPVRLRGVGLGGWMNMENFITGYPGHRVTQRRPCATALGEEGYEAFFDRFLDVFFGDADAAFIASLGLNSRPPPGELPPLRGRRAPVRAQGGRVPAPRPGHRALRPHGLYTIIDLHALPGCQNQHWHSDNPTHRRSFWTHQHFQDRVVHLWEALADRYRDNPWVAGYNPINEPGDAAGRSIGPFYERLHEAVRAVDPDHILFLDGNRYATTSTCSASRAPNTVYTVHDYALPGFFDGGDYPGVTRGRVRRPRPRSSRRSCARTDYMRRDRHADLGRRVRPGLHRRPERDEQRYQMLRDQLEIYDRARRRLGAVDVQGHRPAGAGPRRPGGPYLSRFGAVIAKKARLGADRWGSTMEETADDLAPAAPADGHRGPVLEPVPVGARATRSTT